MKISNFKFQNSNHEKASGFTLIEALTALSIFGLISVTFYATISIGLRRIQDTKSRLGATSLAREKLEIARNIRYENVGNQGGGVAVSGIIPLDESVNQNGSQYQVHTEVAYIDDPFDGSYPADLIPNDYKRVTVTVSWNSSGLSDGQVVISSRFVPYGLEVLNPGDGILSINVFSDQPGGTGIPGSTVRIVNNDIGLDVSQHTDASGNLILVGGNIDNSVQKYQITLTKDGYETVSTMPPYPTSPYNPTDVHASVTGAGINVANIVQNELTNLNISTVNYLNESLPDIDFHLVGGRQLGTEYDFPNDPVFNFDQNSTTGSDGKKSFNDISPGAYVFTLSPAETGYELIGITPSSPFALHSSDDLNVKVNLANKDITSLLVNVQRLDDGTAISGANVRLTNGSGYDETQTSGTEGNVFFPVSADPFISGVYDISVTADGYNNKSSQVTISEGQLFHENMELTPL